MKTLFIIIGIVISILLVSLFFKYHPSSNATFVKLFPMNALNVASQPQANLNGHTITLLLAKTEKEQHMGLSDKNSLPKNTGMLFVFPHPDYYVFWMRHVKFSLDIIYIKNNKVVTILEQVKNPPYDMQNPPLLRPHSPANNVLEVSAGTAKKYNVKVGDTIAFSNI